MVKHILLAICLFAGFVIPAQVTIIGHNQINNDKLANTKILVKDGDEIIQKLDTKNSGDFMLKLPFGKIYRVYFQNQISPVMFMEVIANNIPQDKFEHRMTYELNVPFVYKDDEDIDTTVFVKPWHKVIYNGQSKMVDDTAYNFSFARKVVKVNPYAEVKKAEGVKQEVPVTLGGRACLNGDIKLSLTNKSISLLNKNGQVIKSTKTNRSGEFAFTGIKVSEAGKIKIETKENDLNNGQITILNREGKKAAAGKFTQGIGCELALNDDGVKLLTDNNFTYNIGGKLIHTSGNQKKFYANKTIYLSNKRNTIIRKTTSNVLGTFVFEDIKPDNTYFIGVDAAEIGKGEKIDFLNKDDKFISALDTLAAARKSIQVNTDYNQTFNDISISDDEMRMNVKAKLFGDNTNNPIGKLKILLLNDNYQIIDSAYTDDFGAFKFKYLPFLKRFYLSAENTNNILDVFNNILVYSSEDNMIKIMTHQKGTKFNYKPVATEMTKLTEIEIDDPWLEFVQTDNKPKNQTRSLTAKKTITENILFENNKANLLPAAKEILDKIILVLNTNQKLKVELSAHTDSKGNDADNLKLSQLRAKTATEYITAAGVAASRIISVGYGESKLKNNCGNNIPCSEIEHAQNRRVEFKILEE